MFLISRPTGIVKDLKNKLPSGSKGVKGTDSFPSSPAGLMELNKNIPV